MEIRQSIIRDRSIIEVSLSRPHRFVSWSNLSKGYLRPGIQIDSRLSETKFYRLMRSFS